MYLVGMYANRKEFVFNNNGERTALFSKKREIN